MLPAFLNPGLQLHAKLPSVFSQVSVSLLQLFNDVELHSLISFKKKEDKTALKWFFFESMKNYIRTLNLENMHVKY